MTRMPPLPPMPRPPPPPPAASNGAAAPQLHAIADAYVSAPETPKVPRVPSLDVVDAAAVVRHTQADDLHPEPVEEEKEVPAVAADSEDEDEDDAAESQPAPVRVPAPPSYPPPEHRRKGTPPAPVRRTQSLSREELKMREHDRGGGRATPRTRHAASEGTDSGDESGQVYVERDGVYDAAGDGEHETRDDELVRPDRRVDVGEGALDAEEACRLAASRRDIASMRVSVLENNVLVHLNETVRRDLSALRYILPRDLVISNAVYDVMVARKYVFGEMKRTGAPVLLWCRCRFADTCEHRQG